MWVWASPQHRCSALCLVLEGVKKCVPSDSDSDSRTRRGFFTKKRTHNVLSAVANSQLFVFLLFFRVLHAFSSWKVSILLLKICCAVYLSQHWKFQKRSENRIYVAMKVDCRGLWAQCGLTVKCQSGERVDIGLSPLWLSVLFNSWGLVFFSFWLCPS